MDFLEMLGLSDMSFTFDLSLEGFDGECFSYSIYFDGYKPEDKKEEIDAAIEEAVKEFGGNDNYIGYIDVSIDGNKVFVYHDLGGVEPDYCNRAIQCVLQAFNDINGIKNIIINEGGALEF